MVLVLIFVNIIWTMHTHTHTYTTYIHTIQDLFCGLGVGSKGAVDLGRKKRQVVYYGRYSQLWATYEEENLMADSTLKPNWSKSHLWLLLLNVRLVYSAWSMIWFRMRQLAYITKTSMELERLSLLRCTMSSWIWHLASAMSSRWYLYVFIWETFMTFRGSDLQKISSETFWLQLGSKKQSD